MKFKISILLMIAFFLFQQKDFAQENGHELVIDGFYGYSIIASNATFTYDGTLVSLSKDRLGPLGARADYIFMNNMSTGVEFNYRKNDLDLDYISPLDTMQYHAYKRSRQVRIMARLGYHFINNEQFDAYVGVAGGYVNRDLSVDAEEFNFNYDLGRLFEFPVAARAYIGGRYFPVRNVGINLEIGVGGGSFVNGGLSLGI